MVPGDPLIRSLFILVLNVALLTGINVSPSASQPATTPVTEEGTLEVLHEDRDPGSRYIYHLHTRRERLELRFAGHPPELLTGAHVRAKGMRSGNILALGSDGSVQTLALASPNTFGAQHTLVILVNFQDKAVEPYTVSYAQNVVFGLTSNWYMENSYGQAWLTGDVVGWYTIPLDSTVCDASSIAT